MTTQRDKGALDQLNWDMEPERDLWPNIAARIKEEAPVQSNVTQLPVRSTPMWMPVAMAACLVLAVGSVSFSYYAMQRNNEYMELQATVLMQHQETIRAIEAQHQDVKLRLASLLSNPDGNLDPTLVAEANAILDTTSAASEEIKQAIANAPDKQAYLAMLVKTYQRETELLDRIKLGQELSI